MPRIATSRRQAERNPRAHVSASLVAHAWAEFCAHHRLSLSLLAGFFDESEATVGRVMAGMPALTEWRVAMLPRTLLLLWQSRVLQINEQVGAED